MQITTIGLDLVKHWFQVHGVDVNGRVVVRRRLWRSGVIPYFRSIEPSDARKGKHGQRSRLVLRARSAQRSDILHRSRRCLGSRGHKMSSGCGRWGLQGE
jgi:hypothetical protein